MKGSNATSNKPARRAGPPASGDSSSRLDERFRLTGPSLTLDPTVNAYRKDIADIALAGSIFAPHYARPLVRVAGAETEVFAEASDASVRVARLAPGETFAVLEYAGGWAWGYVCGGHRVGYVEAARLSPAA